MSRIKFMQTDSRWGNLGYPKAPCYLRNCGCGEVSIANILVEMEQYRKYTPRTIQPYCKQFGAPNCDGTYFSGIPKMLSHYGLTEVKEHQTMSSLWKELKKGGRVAVYLMGSRRGGSKGVHWSSGGHFVCSVDYKGQNGKHYVFVKDSYSNRRRRNGWITYEENMRSDVLRVWSAKLNSKKVKAYVPTKPYTGKLPKGTVAKGDKGADVKAVQTFLNWCIGTKLKVDGHCGDMTDKAIRRYQKKYGLTVDGSFGKKSLAKAKAIIKKYAPKASAKPTETKKPAATKKPTKAEKKLTKPEKAVAWAKRIAADQTYIYVVWGKDKRTHLCPICRGYKGWLKGFNCIRFVFSAWYHGGGIKCKHEGGLINNTLGQKMYNAKTNAEALRIAKKAIGCDDITILRNRKGIPQSLLKEGDACMYFKGGVYKHMFLYAGGGYMVDSGRWKLKSKQIAVRKALTPCIVIRYTGK